MTDCSRVTAHLSTCILHTIEHVDSVTPPYSIIRQTSCQPTPCNGIAPFLSRQVRPILQRPILVLGHMHRDFAHEQARHKACSTEANEHFPHELQALGERESYLRAQGLLQSGDLRDNRVCEWGALGKELDEGGGEALAQFVLKGSVSN